MRVIAAMSGGVDSAVTAALLLEQGYEVIAVTLRLWHSDDIEPPEEGCCSLTGVEDARSVAFRLGIPFYALNAETAFREKVVNDFADEYLCGRTPNPCIVCNREIKFKYLLDKVEELQGDFLATGHYVRRESDPENGRWLLRKGCDDAKDQSYVLYCLTQRQLERTLFPLGNYTKTAVRAKAAELGLNVAGKPDSQEICFVPDGKHGEFIGAYRPGVVKPGKIVTTEGKVLGKHSGIVNYTIGQRKGLGIATGVPLYITELRADKDEVVVGSNEELYGTGLVATHLNWVALEGITEPLRVQAKIRYTAKAVPAMIYPVGPDKVEVHFEEPQRAITPGQAVVFYREDLVLGGGMIERRI